MPHSIDDVFTAGPQHNRRVSARETPRESRFAGLATTRERGGDGVRVAVIYRPRSAAPFEAGPMLMEALGQWVETYPLPI